MNTKIIAAIALLAMTLTAFAPLGQAQDAETDYELTVTNPVVFLASTLRGNVSGPNGTYYQVILVNRTSYESFTIGGGVFNSSHQENYSRYMNPDYYPAGYYTINLTVEDETVLIIQVTLVYDQIYVFWKKISDIVTELTLLVYRVGDIEDYVVADNQNERSQNWMLFLETVILIFVLMMILYFIVLRFFKVRYAYGKVRDAYNLRRLKGPDIDPVAFADLEHEMPTAESMPCMDPIMEILEKSGVPAALAAEWALDVHGDFVLSMLVEKEMTNREKKRIERQKAAKIEKAVKQ